MKILKLEFENINNLKGKHFLDFTAKPLLGAPIFAITGPTGSGKSTLLDVITLALFNRTPRFKSTSKKELSEKGSIITRNQRSAFAQITYQIGGESFISKWEIKYNRNNKLDDYHMEIITKGEVLDIRRSNVPKKNEQIIGLDYEQFTKAIILSQGEFSKFIKADTNQRSALLEKITGTEIYRSLGIKAFEVYKEKKIELDLLKNQIEAIKVLSEEEIDRLATLKLQSKSDLVSKNKLIEEQSKLLIQRTEFDNVVRKIKEYEIAQVANDKAVLVFSKELERLQLHKVIIPFRKEILDYLKRSELIEQGKLNLKLYTENYEKELKRNKSVIEKQQALISQNVTKENFLDKNREFEQKVKNLDVKCDYAYKEGVRLSEQVNAISRTPVIKDYQFNNKTSLVAVEEAISLIDSLLFKKNYSANTDVRLIEEDKLLIDLLLQDYKQIANYKEEVLRVQKELVESSGVLERLIQEFDLMPITLKNLVAEINVLGLLIAAKESEQRVASFEEQRKELVKGDACPLCGAIEHPYVSQQIKKEEEVSLSLADYKKQLEVKKNTLSKLQADEKVFKTKIEAQKEYNVKQTKVLESLKSRTKLALNNPQLFDDTISLNVADFIKNTENNKVLISQILVAYHKVEPLQRLKISMTQLAKLRVDYTVLKKERNHLYFGEDIVSVMSELQSIFNDSSSNIKLHHNSILQEEKQLKVNTSEFVLLKERLEVVKKRTGITSLTSLQKSMLSDEEFASLELKKEQLRSKRVQLDALVKESKERMFKIDEKEVSLVVVSVIKQELEKLSKDQEECVGVIAKIEEQLRINSEAQQRKKVFDDLYIKASKEFVRWGDLKELIGDAKGKGFSSFAQELTLRQLIAFTNKRLKSFSGRYLIYSDSVTSELMIVDRFQGDAERSIQTLSGGEIFIVSLALALSLSDMASNNVTLESMFIDEGFGTLDQDTLETAINLLEKLQNESSKTVGVISHVDQLKDRIGVQVQLHKNSQGFSNIVIVG